MIIIKNPETGARIEMTKERIEELRASVQESERQDRDEVIFAAMRLDIDDAKQILAAE